MRYVSFILILFFSIVFTHTVYAQKKLIEYLETNNNSEAIAFLQKNEIKNIHAPVENASFTSFIIKAIDTRNIEILQLMVEKQHADINKPIKIKNSYDTLTPIEYATLIGNTDAFDFLLKQGADIRHANNNKVSVIHYAAKNHRITILQKLLEKGISIETPDSKGYTPLMYAVQERAWFYIDNAERMLIAEQKKLFQIRLEFDTIMDLAFFKHEKEKIEKYASIVFPAVEFLLNHNADINATSYDNSTPLYISLNHSESKLKYYLLIRNANPTIKKSEQENCFCSALKFESPQFLSLIIKQGTVPTCSYNALYQILENITKCNNNIRNNTNAQANKEYIKTWFVVYAYLLQSNKYVDSYTLEFVKNYISSKNLNIDNSTVFLYDLLLYAISYNFDITDSKIWFYVSTLHTSDKDLQKKYHEIIYTLIKKGVDIQSIESQRKNNILEYAIIYDDMVLMEKLLQMGAKTQKGTVLDYAIYDWTSPKAVTYILNNHIVSPSKQEIEDMMQFSKTKIDIRYRQADYEQIIEVLTTYHRTNFK